MDIVERLNTHKNCGEGDCENGALLTEAASEISFLRREIERFGLRLRIEEGRGVVDVADDIGRMLEPGAIVPVDIKTTALLVQEIRRLRDLR
jgi:hypothetical protein